MIFFCKTLNCNIETQIKSCFHQYKIWICWKCAAKHWWPFELSVCESDLDSLTIARLSELVCKYIFYGRYYFNAQWFHFSAHNLVRNRKRNISIAFPDIFSLYFAIFHHLGSHGKVHNCMDFQWNLQKNYPNRTKRAAILQKMRNPLGLPFLPSGLGNSNSGVTIFTQRRMDHFELRCCHSYI